MLPRATRIPRKALLSGSGRRLQFPFGTVKFLGGIDTQGAVIVSKKIAKTAPSRNKIRRRVYAIMREAFKTNRVKGSVIVYPNKEALSAPFSSLKESLDKIFERGR